MISTAFSLTDCALPTASARLPALKASDASVHVCVTVASVAFADSNFSLSRPAGSCLRFRENFDSFTDHIHHPREASAQVLPACGELVLFCSCGRSQILHFRCNILGAGECLLILTLLEIVLCCRERIFNSLEFVWNDTWQPRA